MRYTDPTHDQAMRRQIRLASRASDAFSNLETRSPVPQEPREQAGPLCVALPWRSRLVSFIRDLLASIGLLLLVYTISFAGGIAQDFSEYEVQ